MPSKNSSGRILGGLILIGLGILFLLDQLGRLDFGDIFSDYWPVILILIGLWSLASHGFRNAEGGWILVFLGAFFLLMNLEILGRDLWHYWPVIIIVVGLWIVFKSFLLPSRHDFPHVSADDLNASGVLSGGMRRVDSQNFRGGKASCILGGMEIDLREARLAEGKATIEATAILGGMEIWVPKDWQVVVEGTPILGSIENKHRPTAPAQSPQTLFIRATAILAGIEIKN